MLVVLAGLGAYIYFVERKRPSSSEAGATREKVFSIESDKVEELALKNDKGETTTLRKVNGTWQVVAPIQAKADQTESSSLATSLASLEVQRVVEESPADLAQFGLAKPRVEVSFKMAGDAKPRRLLLGDKTATASDMYAMLDGQKRVFLIAGYLDGTFNRGTFDVRDKAILTFERDKIDTVEVTAEKGAVVLAKEGSDWKLRKPWAVPADYGTVEGLVGRLNTAQMKALPAAEATDLKPYGLDKPVATVTIGAGSTRATLLVGSKDADGNIYARDTSRPMVFTVESSLIDDVNKAPADYRRKDVFEFRSFNATRLDLVRDGKTTTFEKVKGTGANATDTWKQTAPTAREVDGPKMDTLLSRLSNLRAQSFVEPGAKTGAESPVLTAIAKFDEGKKQERVVFGRVGGDTFAIREGEPGAAKLTTTEVDDVLKAFDEVMAQPAKPAETAATEPAKK
jgi:hypothetical protein